MCHLILETADEAKNKAQTYIRRVCLWHGHDKEIELFGHPLERVKAMSQVDIFGSESGDEEDSEWYVVYDFKMKRMRSVHRCPATVLRDCEP